jgi:YgiT-type zinc finger domain-containing protein
MNPLALVCPICHSLLLGETEVREHVCPLGDPIRRHVDPSIVCPRCGARSFHPRDIEQRYCGFCHDWHENM